MQIYANHVIHGLLKVKGKKTYNVKLSWNSIYVTVHFQPLLAEPTEFGDFTQLGQVEAVLKIIRPKEVESVHMERTQSRLFLQLWYPPSNNVFICQGNLHPVVEINFYCFSWQIIPLGSSALMSSLSGSKYSSEYFDHFPFLQSRASWLSLNPCNVFFCKRFFGFQVHLFQQDDEHIVQHPEQV